MSIVFILNGAQPYLFAAGARNEAIASRAREFMKYHGHGLSMPEEAQGYDIRTKLANRQWADMIILQFPVNWMGVP